MHFYTYKITNLLNGKIYVGVHKTSDLNDDYMGSGKHLKNSQNKYGIENFKKEILMFHESENEMFEIEELIVDQHFVDRKDTYNLKLGGSGGWDLVNKIKPFEERQQSARKMNAKFKFKYQNDENFKNKMQSIWSENLKKLNQSEDFKNKIIAASKLRIGSKHSEESKLKMSISSKGKGCGKDNSQFGKMWIYSIDEQKSIRINKNDPIPDGWVKGRISNFDFLNKCCEKCGVNLNLKKNSNQKFCKDHKHSTKEKEAIAISSFDKFKNGNFNSPYEFYKNGNYESSYQSMIKMWKKYVPEYEIYRSQGKKI